MRGIQRGISTLIILIILLIAGVAITSGYFIFYENQKKIIQVNSFEECAKYYPVMQSYPAQCNTADGKHFVQQLSEEEKKKLIPPETTSSPDKVEETENWKIYKNSKYSFSIKYPEDWIFEVTNNEVIDIHLFNMQPKTHTVCEEGFIGMELVVQPKPDGSGDFETLVTKTIKEANEIGGYDMGAKGKIEGYILNGYQVFKVQRSGWDVACAREGYFIELNEKTYIYVFTGSNARDQDAKIIEDILGTIRS